MKLSQLGLFLRTWSGFAFTKKASSVQFLAITEVILRSTVNTGVMETDHRASGKHSCFLWVKKLSRKWTLIQQSLSLSVFILAEASLPHSRWMHNSKPMLDYYLHAFNLPSDFLPSTLSCILLTLSQKTVWFYQIKIEVMRLMGCDWQHSSDCCLAHCLSKANAFKWKIVFFQPILLKFATTCSRQF